MTLSEQLFHPDGERLDVDSVVAAANADDEFRDLAWGGMTPELPVIGLYGKLGPKKGTSELLAAIARLHGAGQRVNLLAMAHGRGAREQEFRDQAVELGLDGYVQQIPFLPHWRVPQFLRRCNVVCCLEQDFPWLRLKAKQP